MTRVRMMRVSTMELKFFAGLPSVALALSGDAGAQQASTSPHMILVRKNTALKFALLEPLDPVPAKVSDDVPLRLVRPLVVDGVTLLPAGWYVPRPSHEGETTH
jgi:hypothetical protein